MGLKFQAEKKERLDKFLASATKVSRGKIQKTIKDGRVSINQKKVLETDYPVKAGDVVELPEFESDELKPMDMKLKVVFENDDLLVIDKPAGLVVHPGAGHTDDTLSNALIAQFPSIKNVGESQRPGIVHRLDEDTSGLLVVAKTTETYEYLKKLFSSRNIEKYYLTLVHGIPDKLHGFVNTLIGKTSTHQKMKTGVGRSALTEYAQVAVGKLGLDQVALLKVKLHTGRTHQIRVHLASIGHPVFGDSLYGGFFKQQDSQVLNRQFLHAYKLKFQLLDDTWIEVFSPLPSELAQILNKSTIKYDDSKL